MGKRVTVYDIAKELNISPSTVSRVLNNSSLISNERSSQILDTAERLGYEKRNIKKHMSRVILNIHLFLPQAESTVIHFFYNISELIDSIQKGFGDVRLNFITRVNDGNTEFLEKKKTGQIDGCLFAFTAPGRELSEKLKERGIPAILLNRTSPNHNYICYNISGGISLLSSRLYEAGKETIKPCYMGYRGLPKVSETRYQAVSSWFNEHNIPFGGDNRLEVKRFEDIPDTGLSWIRENGFNAVIAFNDMVAVSLLQAAYSRGLKVPEDFALTGVDNSPLQKLLGRQIDTVSLSIPEIGCRAGSWLKQAIIDKNTVKIQDIIETVYIPGDTIQKKPG